MTVDNSEDSSPLILKELDVPGRTGPVSQAPDVWGLNIAAVQDNFPRQGLLCRAGPWGVMSRGDTLKMTLDNQTVFNKTVDEHEVNTRLSMFISAARFRDGRSILAYAVTRQGGTPEPSEEMHGWVKLSRPGGPKTDEGPGHPKLKMTIPREILEGGIDKDNIGPGVLITIGPSDDGPQPYVNAAAGDFVYLIWGGVSVIYGPLSQEEADGTVPLVVHVTEATIREAGDSGDTGTPVAYELYDMVDNRSEDWSPEQRVMVAVDADRLSAPLCKEAQNNVLDVDKLGDADGTAQIFAVNETGKIKFEVGDILIARLRGTPVEGAPIDIEIPGQPLVSVPSIAEIGTPNAALRQLAKTLFRLSFRLKKADGSADLLSKTQFINVIGEIKRLQAPVALDAAQGALDPELAQARIEIPFDKSFAAGQAIKLIWLGTRPDLSTYLPDLPLRPITNGDIVAGKPLLINVEGLHLKQIRGGTLNLYYQLLIDDAVLATMNRFNAIHAIRESIHAEILNVGEPRKELPEPKVEGVEDGVLPADTAGTTLTVEYLNTVKDDEVFCVWLGSKTGRYEDSLKLSSFTAGQPVPFTISAELIKGNEGGKVDASYSIKWADGRPTSYSDGNPFSVGVAIPDIKPVITRAEDSEGVEIPEGSVTDKTSMTLIGTAAENQQVEVFDGTTSKGDAKADSERRWTKNVSGLTPGAHLFTARAKYGSEQVSDVRTLFVFQQATIPVGRGPDSVAVFPNGSLAYVVNYRSNFVSVIDTQAQKVINTIPTDQYSMRCAISPDGKQAYITNQVTHSVSVIDTQSHTLSKAIDVGTTTTEVAFFPDGARACVIAHRPPALLMIDTQRQTVIDTIPLPQPVFGIAIHPNGSRLYFNTNDSVLVFDTTLLLIASIPVDGVNAIALLPDGSQLYVAGADNSVHVIDIQELKITNTIPVGKAPRAIVIHPDGSVAYVLTTDVDTDHASFVETIDIRRQLVIKTSPVGTGSGSIAVHPDGKRLLVANFDDDTVSIIAAK